MTEKIELLVWYVCHLGPFVYATNEKVKCLLEISEKHALRPARAPEPHQVYRVNVEVRSQVAYQLAELGTSRHVAMD